MRAFPKASKGLSLIEVMVALLIGTLLMLGLVQVFSASRTAYQLSEGLARAQENARFAIDILQRDIRMAGHFGCVNDQAHFVKGEGDPRLNFSSAPAASSALDFSISIQGYEAPATAPTGVAGTGRLVLGQAWDKPADIPTAIDDLGVLGGSDILVLRYLTGQGIPVMTITTDGANDIVQFTASSAALTADGVATPQLFGVADCTHADVFPGTLSGNTVRSTAPTGLAARYTSQPVGETMLYRADSIVYYVAPGASGEPSLWRARANASGAYAQREELVEGIESLQLLYGQDEVANLSASTPPKGHVANQNTATGALSGATTTAARANAWRRVGMVQVGILARSPNPAAATQAQAADTRYRVLGVDIAPGTTDDRRYRASYEVSVALRNRLFGN